MNVSLFRSWWSVVAVIVSGGFVWWLAAAGSAAGAREGSDVDIVLASGWTTLGIMVAVCVYSLRKFMHRLGISPEFKLKVPLEQLEQAEQGLNDIRRRVLLGLLNNAAEIREMAQRELAAHGADRICKAKVTPGAVGGPAFIVGVEPTEPLGRMSRWLHFHVYLGLASGVTLWVHGGFSMVSPMGVILNGLAVLVIVTGVVGTVLFALGPRWMTPAARADPDVIDGSRAGLRAGAEPEGQDPGSLRWAGRARGEAAQGGGEGDDPGPGAPHRSHEHDGGGA